MKLPIYDCIIDDNPDDISGIYAMSFVEDPANEINFVALAKQQQKVYLNKDTQKQILTGVVLRPEQLIYRSDARLGEYYIKFSASQIEKIAQKMMRTGIALQSTTHQHQASLKGNYLTELWIVEDPANDKANALGFSNLPKGTLMCSYKIEDTNYWQTEVMGGKVKGFSLEGIFEQEKITMSKSNNKNKMKRKKLGYLQKKGLLALGLSKIQLDALEQVESGDATNSGNTVVIFTLENGQDAIVDIDGFVTLDGEQMPAGEHLLANGNVLVVDENGNFVETKATADSAAANSKTTAPQTLTKHRNMKYKLDDTTSQTEDDLKAEIEELKAQIEKLEAELEKAKSETTRLRRVTPSAQSIRAQVETNLSNMKNLKTYQKIALMANEQSKRQINK